MSLPKVLVFAGSIRTGSFNARLAALATKELLLAGADVTRISLLDYPMPLYDGDLEAKSGPPENAIKLKKLMSIHPGVMIRPDASMILSAGSSMGTGEMRATLPSSTRRYPIPSRLLDGSIRRAWSNRIDVMARRPIG